MMGGVSKGEGTDSAKAMRPAVVEEQVAPEGLVSRKGLGCYYK